MEMADKMKESPKIIVIGAGLSGISVSNELYSNGISDILVLEATNRTGGRISTVDLETVNYKAELGAQWIHAIELNPIFKLAKERGLLSGGGYEGRKLGKKTMFLMEGGQPVNTKMVEEIDWGFGMLMSQCEDFYQSQIPTPMEDQSVGDYVWQEFTEKLSRYSGMERLVREMILTQRLLGEAVIQGSADMHEVSLSEIGSFQELPGVHYTIPPGFEEVVNVLKQDFPAEKILLDHPVTQISWNATGQSEYPVCVQCQNGRTFSADHVVVTTSLGYLKKNCDRLFNPNLPKKKIKAINNLAMGTVNKIILEFVSGPVLPQAVTRLEMIRDRSKLASENLSTSWMKKVTSWDVLAGNVLLGWISGPEAVYMEGLSEEDVANGCLQTLKEYLLDWEVPKLHRVLRTRWNSNPYTMGSYSFIPTGGLTEDVETLAEPVADDDEKPVILFAGEATHSSFYSSAHGALLSGKRESQRILDIYKEH